MELRRYGQILLRYWWVVLLFTLAGAFLAYTQYKSTTANYQAAFQVNVQRNDPPPTQDNKGYQDYFEYYQSLSAEYILDDFVMVAKGSVFLTDVSNTLKSTQYPMSVDDLKGAFDVERKHRELIFTARADSEERVLVLAKALSSNMEKNAGKYLARGEEQKISGRVIDFPTSAAYNSGRNILVSSVRLIVGLILGVGLAFLLAYLDNRLRKPDDFSEVLGLPIMGQIPGKTAFPFGKNGGSNNPGTPAPPEPQREEARR
jgi:capsular polysaccharide biosynthesis protein